MSQTFIKILHDKMLNRVIEVLLIFDIININIKLIIIFVNEEYSFVPANNDWAILFIHKNDN